MATRDSMAALIARVRGMISDVASPQQFSDQEIQDVLDDTRLVVRYAVLRAEPTLGQGGILSYNDYYADLNDWEDAPATQLYGPSFQLLSPATSDTLTGHWTFTLPSPGQLRPVFIVGASYDRYMAAAELLERWAAALMDAYDFSAAGQSFRRSQRGDRRVLLAAKYRQKARPKTVPMDNQDVDTGVPWPYGDISYTDW